MLFQLRGTVGAKTGSGQSRASWSFARSGAGVCRRGTGLTHDGKTITMSMQVQWQLRCRSWRTR